MKDNLRTEAELQFPKQMRGFEEWWMDVSHSISGELDGQGGEGVIAIGSFKVTHFIKAKRIIETELFHATALLFRRCRRTQKRRKKKRPITMNLCLNPLMIIASGNKTHRWMWMVCMKVDYGSDVDEWMTGHSWSHVHPADTRGRTGLENR